MREYKRLTEYSEVNQDYITPFCDTVDCDGKCLYCDYEQVIVNRLAELEDKIENGTLIELGYHIRKSYRNHDDQRYKIILIDEVEIDKIGYDCLTKAEAEQKLKELKGEV